MQGDQVVLDVSEVIDQVKQRLIDRGLTIVERVPIPDVDGRSSCWAPQLKQARTIYAFGNPVARWLIVLVAALYLAAFILSAQPPEDDDHHRRGARRQCHPRRFDAGDRTAAVHQPAGRDRVRAG